MEIATKQHFTGLTERLERRGRQLPGGLQPPDDATEADSIQPGIAQLTAELLKLRVAAASGWGALRNETENSYGRL